MIREKLILVLITLLVGTNASWAGSDSSNSALSGGANPHAISLYNLGLNAYKQGSPESAIIFFKRAVDLDPDLADAQYNLGVLYQSERRLKEAVPRFKEALRIKPEDADSHYQLALALIDLNLLTEARQNFMAIAPNNSHFAEAQKKIAYVDAQLSSAVAGTPIEQGQTAISQSTSVVTSTVNTASNNTIANPVANPVSNPVANTTQTVVPSLNGQNVESSTGTVTAPVGTVSAAAAATPTALIDNASVQTVGNGFAAPSGLTFDRQGNLYVANFASSTIDRLSPDGRKSQFSTGINLKGPIGLISDDENNIYVANYLAGTVTRINPAGIAQVIVNGLRKPYYLAMDKEGNLFVSQQEDNTIVRINLPRNLSSDTVGQTTTP